MSLKTEADEITEIVERTLDNLGAAIGSTSREVGAPARRQIGIVHADFLEMIKRRTFGVNLLECFKLLREIPAKLSAISYVREQLFLEQPTGPIANAVVQTAILMCLSTESRILTATEFTSRDAVEEMMRVMKVAFDTARDIASDVMDSQAYQNLTLLSGALTQHLSSTARPLPRVITFRVSKSYPAMPLANLLYHDPSRWEEMVAENKTVHNPAFMPRVLRGLSA